MNLDLIDEALCSRSSAVRAHGRKCSAMLAQLSNMLEEDAVVAELEDRATIPNQREHELAKS